MRIGVAAFAVLIIVNGVLTIVNANDATKPIAEVDALRLSKLYAERQLFEQALLKLAAQQESIRVQTQLTRRDQDAKNAELNAAIVAAGETVGLTADDIRAGWTPDLDQRVWVKVETKR